MLQRTYFRTVTKWVNTILFSTLQCAELTFSIFWDKICMDYLENWLFMDKKQGNVIQVQLWEISWRCQQKVYWKYILKRFRSIFSARLSDELRNFKKSQGGCLLEPSRWCLRALKESDHQLSSPIEMLISSRNTGQEPKSKQDAGFGMLCFI